MLEQGGVAWSLLLSRWVADGRLRIDGLPEDTWELCCTLWSTQPATLRDQLTAVLPNLQPHTDAPWWMRLVLGVFHPDARALDLELELFDMLVQGVSEQQRASLGICLPLTLALLHARGGDVARAAAVLDPAHADAPRPFGLTGLHHPEALYHRSRYLWLAGQTGPAIDLLINLIDAHPGYLLRAVTDGVWERALEDPQGMVRARIEGHLATARARVSAPPTVPAGYPQEDAARQAILRGAESPYATLLASRWLQDIARWEAERPVLTPELREDLTRVAGFSKALPRNFPLRLGPANGPAFQGFPGSDLETLRSLSQQGQYLEAGVLARQMIRELPVYCRLSLVNYLRRLFNSLEVARETVAAQGGEARRALFERLALECGGIYERLLRLPSQLTPELAPAVSGIWDEILAVEQQWISNDQRAFGRLVIEVDPVHGAPPIVLRAGEDTLIRLRVTDVQGRPVAGVPIVWSLVGAEVRPASAVEALALEWALSLDTGAVFVRVHNGSRVGPATLRCAVLGGAALEVPLQVEYAGATASTGTGPR
jgi:hypothetical protein